MNELQTTQTTDLAAIDYNVTDAAIAELKQKHVASTVTNNRELAVVQASITELTKIRTSVEKKRKELKADALEWGRKVDTEAKRITALIEEIEQPLIDVKKSYNDEQERIKAEAARKEKERVEVIKERIDSIRNFTLKMMGKTALEIEVAVVHLTACSAGMNLITKSL